MSTTNENEKKREARMKKGNGKNCSIKCSFNLIANHTTNSNLYVLGDHVEHRTMLVALAGMDNPMTHMNRTVRIHCDTMLILVDRAAIKQKKTEKT